MPTTTTLEELQFLPLDRSLALGLDVGGTQVSVAVAEDSETGAPMKFRCFATVDFARFDDVLTKILRDLGVRPAKVFAGLPGLIKQGRCTPTNIKRWGTIDLNEIARATGMVVGGGSDLMVKAAGARALNAALHAAIEGGVSEPGTRLVATWSTGINSVYEVLQSDGTYRYFKAESGHISWQAQTPMEERYMRYLRRVYKTNTISVEWAASGSHGFSNACRFLLQELRHPRNWLRSDLRPSGSLRSGLENALRSGTDVGPLIDRAAASGDGFALTVIKLVAAPFGDYLRTLALVELPSDGIVLTGGVSGNPYFQRLYAELVWERFIGRGAEFSEDLAATDLRFADHATNAELGPRGAAILASQLSE